MNSGFIADRSRQRMVSPLRREFLLDRPRHDIARRQRTARIDRVHEPLAAGVEQHAALARAALRSRESAARSSWQKPSGETARIRDRSGARPRDKPSPRRGRRCPADSWCAEKSARARPSPESFSSPRSRPSRRCACRARRRRSTSAADSDPRDRPSCARASADRSRPSPRGA